MASLHISRTSDLLKENLNRCNFKSGLFDSAKLCNIKKNILSEISSKWETFNDNSLTAHNNATGNVQCAARKSKMRSVYGQPEMIRTESMSVFQCNNLCKSLDSLDTCDSGHGLGSNTTSCSDLRTLEGIKPVETIASDLGTSVDSSDNEFESFAKQCNSPTNSHDSSYENADSAEDEALQEEKKFMKQFVNKIFAHSALINLEEKAKFGLYSRSECGRLWFARYITKQRTVHKRVSESTFYSLAQYFAIVLFECAEADHFGPAKSLMNMCFTFYHQVKGGHSVVQSAPHSNTTNWHSGQGGKQYLSSALRDQPIWQSLRFWNAAFFDAVQAERLTFFEKGHHPIHSQQDLLDDWQFQANVTFGQLGTFTYNMYSFGLPKRLCLEFLAKQSTIANLTKEHIQQLEENIEMMYQNNNTRNMD